MYPYYQLYIVIYTVFKNLGIESYRKESAVGLNYGKTKKAEPFLTSRSLNVLKIDSPLHR